MSTAARPKPVDNGRVVAGVMQRLHTRNVNGVDGMADFFRRLWLSPKEAAVLFVKGHEFGRFVFSAMHQRQVPSST
jgi:hypothetical protein